MTRHRKRATVARADAVRVGALPESTESEAMLTDDEMNGVRKANMDEIKEIKVKLPVKQLLKLHYVKLTSNRNISQVVCDALAVYFESPTGEAGAA